MSNVLFSKSSYNRLPEFQTMTVIFSDNGVSGVRKQALSPKANPHICSFVRKYESLSHYYSGKLRVIPCYMDGDDTVEFPFVEGNSLTDVLSEFLSEKKIPQAIECISDLFGQIRSISSVMPIVSDGFAGIFGEAALPHEMLSMIPANIDLTFDNIFLSRMGEYNIIDYEWTFDFPVPTEFILYRALLHSGVISHLNENVRKQVYALLDADEGQLDAFYKMELNFQKYVYGIGRTMRELYGRYGKQAYYTGQPSQFAQSIDIRQAYETEAAERLAAQNRAKELYDAYNTESHAREEAQKQAEEYRTAYNAESHAREEAQKQAEEYRTAYNTESHAREEAQKQAEEYFAAYKEEAGRREEIENKLRGKR